MGMTINKAISHLNTYSSTMGSGQTTQAQHEESKKVAIDTMRKYQKIEQIVNSNPDYIHHTDMDTYKLNSIREVLEDGNDD